MRERKGISLTVPLIALMLLLSLTVITLLCAKAISTERRAVELSQAVIDAGSAAELFYASSSAEELARLLNGEAEGNMVTAPCGQGMTLRIALGAEGNMLRGDISVLGGDGEIYSLSCLRAGDMEGR